MLVFDHSECQMGIDQLINTYIYILLLMFIKNPLTLEGLTFFDIYLMYHIVHFNTILYCELLRCLKFPYIHWPTGGFPLTSTVQPPDAKGGTDESNLRLLRRVQKATQCRSG